MDKKRGNSINDHVTVAGYSIHEVVRHLVNAVLDALPARAGGLEWEGPENSGRVCVVHGKAPRGIPSSEKAADVSKTNPGGNERRARQR